MDHNIFREELNSASRYRQVKDLNISISSVKNKIPLSLYSELSGRVHEKLMGFEYPDCGTSRVTVIFSNGLRKRLEREECHIAMSRGTKLSDYIFSHYISARDFEVENANTISKYVEDERSIRIGHVSDVEVTFNSLSPAALRERVDYILRKVENLERVETIYAENLPKMARDVNDLREKLDVIYRRLVEK